jgi:hypothetical protein
MNTQIVKAVVNEKTEYRVYFNHVIVGRFEHKIYAELLSNRLNGMSYVLVNEDNDVICVFDSEPEMQDVCSQLEESYSMDLQLFPLGGLYTHYEVYGDNFYEVVQVVKTRTQ